MIRQKEIINLSEQWQVPPDTVDKDWVLGHFLSAFYQEKSIWDTVIFKGGTCLRKCYFSDYRFSEDLDFTARDRDFRLTNDLLKSVIERATQHSGILFHALPIEDMRYQNKRTGDTVKIIYWAANHRKNSPPPDDLNRWHHSIKLEIITYEKLTFNSTKQKIIHLYSDKLSTYEDKIPCYDLKEVMAEKIRALVQRKYTAPRDIYDIWKLHEEFNPRQWQHIKQAFLDKMEFKDYEFTGINQLINDKTIQVVRKAWDNSLKHQIPSQDAPNAINVIADVKQVLIENIT